MNEDLIQKFGFSEMYEWSQTPDTNNRHGRFVQFDPEYPNKIKLCSDCKNIVGVSTINASIVSDNPEEWCSKNLFNEYGDAFLQVETLSVGEQVYDQENEMAYIKTRKWQHYIPVQNPNFDNTKEYTKRTNRYEWIRVNILGKCIVEDDGNCKPGEYCTLYKGKIKSKQGTVKPASEKSEIKFYVLKRVSPKTIMILYK